MGTFQKQIDSCFFKNMNGKTVIFPSFSRFPKGFWFCSLPWVYTDKPLEMFLPAPAYDKNVQESQNIDEKSNLGRYYNTN